MGFAVDGDVAAVHDFEEGGLGLGGGAIDLVGENDGGEDGAFFEDKLLGVCVVDGDAGDVTGKEVAGELDAGEGAGERVGEGGFADAGEVFDEEMTAGEQANDSALNDVVFAFDGAAHVGAQLIHRLLGLSHGGAENKIAHGLCNYEVGRMRQTDAGGVAEGKGLGRREVYGTHGARWGGCFVLTDESGCGLLRTASGVG